MSEMSSSLDELDSRAGTTGTSRSTSAKVPKKVQGTRLLELEPLDLYRSIHASREIGHFILTISQLLEPVGIDFWAHHGTSRADALDMFGTFPYEFTSEYVRQQFHREDFVLRLASQFNDYPYVFQEDIVRYMQEAPIVTEETMANLAVTQLHRSVEIKNSCAILVNGHNSKRAIFRLATKKMDADRFRDFIKDNIDRFTLLANYVHEIGWRKFPRKFHPKTNPHVPVAERPLQLLSVLFEKDLTLNEAAEVLEISISTANQHIAAAKKSFGTETTHGTIHEALKYGFIKEP